MHLTVIYSSVDAQQGFACATDIVISGVRTVEVNTWSPRFGRIGFYQSGLISVLKNMRPDAVITFANLRYISFWTTLIWCKIHSIPVFAHGHGLYKKRNPGLLWKTIFRVVLWLSSAYIAYTPSVAESLLRSGLQKKRIAVAENSLINPFPVAPEEKTGQENGILFIGRLRKGCRLDRLISAVARLHIERDSDMALHIIGDGIGAEYLKSTAIDMPWVKFYGAIYDQKKISIISRKCMAGCYPGNSGLSIVHMMSLSLPPITHDDMPNHQGPEPSYIRHGVNGLLFDHRRPDTSLVDTLASLLDNAQKLKDMQIEAFAMNMRLTLPPLSERFLKIINTYLEQ